MKKVIWSLSGSAFYLRGQAYAAHDVDLKHHKKPNLIIGSSGGGVVGLFYAVLGASRMREVANEVNLADAHKWKAKTLKNKMSFRSLMSVVFGGFPVKQDLTKIIHKYISKNAFQGYKLNPSAPDCVVLCVDVVSGERCFYNLKKVPYNEMVTLLNATCAMQGMVKPVEYTATLSRDKRTRLLWDGGQLDHQPIAGYSAADWKNIKDTELITFYSRGEIPTGKNEALDWDLHPFTPSKAGYFDWLNRMVEIDNYEKSINDQHYIRTQCEKNNIKQFEVCINRVLLHFYDNDKDRQYSQCLEGIEAVKRTFKSNTNEQDTETV